jgi:isopenicillin-N epimerase
MDVTTATTPVSIAAPHPMGSAWSLEPGVTFLNHGSFGPSPQPVLQAREDWSRRIEREPMDFFVRRLEPELDLARERLAAFVGARPADLLFVDNATFGMNIVARSLTLRSGDEVLLNDHEYGAVLRIWRARCDEVGARVRIVRFPEPLTSAADLVDTLRDALTPSTRLIVLSHVTSQTATIFPVRAVCEMARAQGVPVCIDGPHAPCVTEIDLSRLGCDYYTASCHKWLSAPFGTGFLWVPPRHQKSLRPVVTSWGGSLAGRSPHWHDEFNWSGTRDYAPFLAIPAALDFFTEVGAGNFDRGVAAFRAHGHALARLARHKVEALTGLACPIPDSPDWYGPMISLPLPVSVPETTHGQMNPLQQRLWEAHRIETPLVNWRGRRWVRVSCHLYNSAADIEHFAKALAEELERFSSGA